MWWMFFFSLGVLKLPVRALLSFLQLSPRKSARPKLFFGFSSYGLKPVYMYFCLLWIFSVFQFLPKSVKCSRPSVTMIFLIKSRSLTSIEGYVPDQNTPYLVKQTKCHNEKKIIFLLFQPVALQSVVRVQIRVGRPFAEQGLVAPVPVRLLRLGKVAPLLEFLHMLLPFVKYQQSNN